MSRKIKTTKTSEQRHAEAEALHASIAEQVKQLRTPTPGADSRTLLKRSTPTA